MVNEILLRRKKKVLIQKKRKTEERNINYVATMSKNIENLGYAFSNELFSMLCRYSKEELGSFYNELIAALMNMKGADVVYKPMYPNFPQQVMHMSEANLYFNAMVHYWSAGTLLPVSERNERLPLFDEGKVEILELGDSEDLDNIFINLVSSRTSLSPADKEDVKWIFNHRPDILLILPESIPYKENAAYVCNLCFSRSDIEPFDVCSKYLKTPTDVLRLAVAMSDGDMSLSENTHFRNFKRSERRLILRLLEQCKAREAEMAKYPMQWIRLGEKIHPFEPRMVGRYPNTAQVFQKLRNDKLRTANSAVEMAIKDKDWKTALDKLYRNPGEFARRLDFLLREIKNPEKVIEQFREISIKISTPVLLQVREHFKYRNNPQQYRVFFPKGSLAKSFNVPNELPKIKTEYCEQIVNICEGALIKAYEQREPMGKVYLSEDFKHYIVPFSQRSASKTLKTIVRGSRIPIDKNTNIIRGFIWWTNFNQEIEISVDIDLSVTFFDKGWNYLSHVSYTNLTDTRYGAYHSGDIVNGGPVDGDGVAEFLDIDINKILEKHGRYAVFQVYDYTGYGFDKLTNAKFGWMEKKSLDSGEIFEPKTVTQKMDLCAKTTSCIPVIFDCLEKEFIWCDMAGDVEYRHSSNVENTLGRVEAVCYSVVNMKKPNLFDLIELNVAARGELVDQKEDADIVFDFNEGITPYDTEVFMGEYL